jgi:hypothetical protein
MFELGVKIDFHKDAPEEFMCKAEKLGFAQKRNLQIYTKIIEE